MSALMRLPNTASASGTGKPSLAGSHESACTSATKVWSPSKVLSQLKVYWRTSSSNTTAASMPASAASHKRWLVWLIVQRMAGFRHSSP